MTKHKEIAMGLREKVGEVIEYVQSGKIVEAMETFYHDDISMQENSGEPTVGLAQNIEREKQFLAQVKDWHGFAAQSVGIEGDERDGARAHVGPDRRGHGAAPHGERAAASREQGEDRPEVLLHGRPSSGSGMPRGRRG